MPTNDVDYEHLPPDQPADETDYSLRAHFARISDEKLREYDPAWSDEQVIEWDDDFTCEGNLLLVCCEREIDVHEYRRALEEHMKFRGITPGGR